MAGVNDSCLWQGINLLANRILQSSEVSAGQIGASDAFPKDRIPHEGDWSGRILIHRKRREKKQHVPRAVPRNVSYLGGRRSQGQSIPLTDPAIHAHRL